MRLQHGGRQHFANPALQRQSAIGGAGIGRLARTLRAKIKHAAPIIPKLREQESAPVAQIGIVHAELMAVIAQGQRLPKRAGQRSEPREMRDPLIIAQISKPGMLRPALIPVTQHR